MFGQLDADDFLEPDAVATMVDCLDNHDVSCVYGRYTKINKDGKVIDASPEISAFSREQMMQGMIVSGAFPFSRLFIPSLIMEN